MQMTYKWSILLIIIIGNMVLFVFQHFNLSDFIVSIIKCIIPNYSLISHFSFQFLVSHSISVFFLFIYISLSPNSSWFSIFTPTTFFSRAYPKSTFLCLVNLYRYVQSQITGHLPREVFPLYPALDIKYQVHNIMPVIV